MPDSHPQSNLAAASAASQLHYRRHPVDAGQWAALMITNVLTLTYSFGGERDNGPHLRTSGSLAAGMISARIDKNFTGAWIGYRLAAVLVPESVRLEL
jgi:hypothetical protein